MLVSKKESPKNITIIGSGYVGLVTSVCLATKNNYVISVDVVPEKVEKINSGVSPIFEDSLDKMLREVVSKGLLHATLNLKEAFYESDYIFIAVPTPSSSSTGKIDLTFIKQVSEELGKLFKETNEYKVVIVKSTVLPGTTVNIVGKTIERISGKKIGKNFGLVMNPEFLREGHAVHDFLNPDRIIIGAVDERSFELVKELYSWSKAPIIRTNPNSAELIKYASNSFLAMKISFINEIANYAELVGVDVKEVAEGMGLDHRISPYFLNAGIGFGGSCFPKDVAALLNHSEEIGRKMKLLDATLKVNSSQPLRVIELLNNVFDKLKEIEVGILGVAFKPGTDDMREAPSIKIVNELIKQGAKVKVHDPVALDNAKRVFPNSNLLSYHKNYEDVIKGSDALILVTEWNDYKFLDPAFIKKQMRGDIIIDGRRLWNPITFISAGLKYFGIGYGIT